MMGNDHHDLAAKDVFVLLDVPVPDHLDINRRRHGIIDSKSDDGSKLSLDSDDKNMVDVVNEPLVINVIPPDELDYSSSDSMTKSEVDEKRWYNVKTNIGLEKSDFDTLKEILKSIKNTDPEKTLIALDNLKSCKILDHSFQNMFITQNGFEVLINLLDCNNKCCIKSALTIIHGMAQYYGVQCKLCDLDAVKPLLGILLFENNNELQHLAMSTLHNISKLRRGRKLIRLSGGIRILVQILDSSKSVITNSKQNFSPINQTVMKLVMANCAGVLRLLCRSLKSQKDIWDSGFIMQLPLLLNAEDIAIQTPIMSLIAECCRSRPNVTSKKLVDRYITALKELQILPQIIQLMLSSTIELAEKAAETILSIFDSDDYIYDVLLKHSGLLVIFKAVEKFQSEERVLELMTKVLWKCSMDKKCRNFMETQRVERIVLGLLTYKFNDRVIGYAIATLSELWKCESLRPMLTQNALPTFLEFLDSSLNSLMLAHVCTALGRMSKDPSCMKTINEVHGFRLVFALLPSLDVDEFDKYDDFYEPETTIAAAECLVEMIKNTPSDHNKLNGMYEALYDLVNLLKHENPDIVASVCRLVEVVAYHDENLKIMVDAEVIENLMKLVGTTHTNLTANLCRALGKCSVGRVVGRKLSCENLIEQLWLYANSKHDIIRDNVPLALSGLSEDPLNCIKIETLGFLPFLIKSVESNNEETAAAAVNCLRNVRKTCAIIGHYSESMTKK